MGLLWPHKDHRHPHNIPQSCCVVRRAVIVVFWFLLTSSLASAFRIVPVVARHGRQQKQPQRLRQQRGCPPPSVLLRQRSTAPTTTALPSTASTTTATATATADDSSATPTATTSFFHDDNKNDAWTVLGERICTTVLQSDRKRHSGLDGSSTGWTSWIDEASATDLQQCINRLALVVSADTTLSTTVTQQSSDGQRALLQWIKACPTPMTLDLSPQLRAAVVSSRAYQALMQQQQHAAALDNNNDDDESSSSTAAKSPTSTVSGSDENNDDGTTVDFLSRIGLRMLYLPSGSSLTDPLQSPPGAMVYGALLLGGVTRFRLIGSGGSSSGHRAKRRAGERTCIVGRQGTEQEQSHNDDDGSSTTWLQYGGPERNYQAVDMGPCLLLEIILLPTGLELPPLCETKSSSNNQNSMMLASSLLDDSCKSLLTLRAIRDDPKNTTTATTATDAVATATSTSLATTKNDNLSRDRLHTTFYAKVGGLRPQIEEIVRRVLEGRVVRSVHDINAAAAKNGAPSESSSSEEEDLVRYQEMKELLDLGLAPIRGLLLYGPPGNGKTHLAREISTILDARPPKIVAAPELLDRWVGGTERMVRDLFVEAEEELKSCGGDVTKSALHVIVVDEIDAVFRKRGDGDGSSEVTRASAVNQLLARLDGVKSLGNILFIGMTNRRELLDPALLRPGRLEVQLEIPPPDQEGRREILNIHFGALRQHGRLSQPLCRAIDGPNADDTSSTENLFSIVPMFRRRRNDPSARIRDLAAPAWTRDWSGAELAGLVRNAGSIALERARNQGDGGVGSLLITLEDVKTALDEANAQR